VHYDVYVRRNTTIICGYLSGYKNPSCHIPCTTEEIVDLKTSWLRMSQQLWCGLAHPSFARNIGTEVLCKE